MERWRKPPQCEFLCQGRRKKPSCSRPHEACKLERMRPNEDVLVRSAESPAGNARALSGGGDRRPHILLGLKPNGHRANGNKETGMITLCIRYTLDISKLADFEDYARRFPEPIERCGGKLVGYYLPTKIAGATNFALALIDFPSLAAYEIYRDNLLADAAALENVGRSEKSGWVLIEDRWR